MLENIKKYDVVLASASPRRRELFEMLNLPFRIEEKEVDEDNVDLSYGLEVVKILAKTKADAYQLADDTMLITADTIVYCEGKVLGKPKDRVNAIEMLTSLIGKTHQVVTGVCIRTKNREELFQSITDVEFATLTREEIEYYVDNYEPYDKAGAYGIQEWIGGVAVKSLDGSYYNVMGLPVQKLYKILKTWGK